MSGEFFCATCVALQYTECVDIQSDNMCCVTEWGHYQISQSSTFKYAIIAWILTVVSYQTLYHHVSPRQTLQVVGTN